MSRLFFLPKIILNVTKLTLDSREIVAIMVSISKQQNKETGS